MSDQALTLSQPDPRTHTARPGLPDTDQRNHIWGHHEYR